MYSTRDIQTRVAFTNPADIYSDQKTNVLRVLRKRYENKCYMSCFIVEVIEILQLSQLIFSRQKTDGSAVCNVQFRVRCIIIKKNDVLHDCKIVKINKHGHILCKNQYAVIYINKHKALQTIREGQIILAIAGIVKYKPLTSLITVSALPFIPMVTPTTQYTLNITPSHVIDKLMEQLEEETKTNASLDSKISSFFTELLFPYANNKRIENKTIMSFANVIKRTGKITLSQPDWLPIGPNLIINEAKNINLLKTEEIQESKNGELVITENYENIMGYFIHVYIEQLLTIRKLCTTYNTMEIINANSNLWNIYTRNRIV